MQKVANFQKRICKILKILKNFKIKNLRLALNQNLHVSYKFIICFDYFKTYKIIFTIFYSMIRNCTILIKFEASIFPKIFLKINFIFILLLSKFSNKFLVRLSLNFFPFKIQQIFWFEVLHLAWEFDIKIFSFLLFNSFNL
jgi:hypothetical protein